jgi:tRNA1Val (adenine37-N6)-methyltransferase
MKLSKPPKIDLLADESIDHFMEGRLRLIQSRHGYRFSIDAVLLSQFVTIARGDVVVDLGTGCGVILLILLLTKPVGRAVGLEAQRDLATQALRNARLNGFSDKMEVILGDIKRLPLVQRSADVVVCNPPYHQTESGRINPDPHKAFARHEILVSLDDILSAAKCLLKKKGRVALIYPAVRLADLLIRLRGFNLEPKRMQINYPSLDSSAKLALVEASLAGRPGLEITPSVFGQGDFHI